MIDSRTQEAIRVTTALNAGPYIVAPLDQLPQIREKLDRHPVLYWVDSDAITIDNEPYVIYINFGRTEDAKKIQAILDDPT